MSLSKTRCVIRQAFHSFGNSVWGASRSRSSLDLGLSLVSDAERSFWQSILGAQACQRLKEISESVRPLDLQELPPIRSHSRTVDVMRIPRPDRIEAFGIQVNGSFEGWGIMKAQIGAKPVDHSRRHHCMRAIANGSDLKISRAHSWWARWIRASGIRVWLRVGWVARYICLAAVIKSLLLRKTSRLPSGLKLEFSGPMIFSHEPISAIPTSRLMYPHEAQV